MDKELVAILDNSTSGSTEILLLLNSYLLNRINNLEEINSIIPHIRTKFKHFAAIGSYISQIEDFINQNNFQGFKNFTRQFATEYQNKYFDLYQNSKPYLDALSSITTISNSNTLLEVFKLWGSDRNNLRVTVSESSPQKEGIIFAQNLLKYHINVRIITDAMAGIFVKESEAVIIGADKVLKNGNVVNKTGSSLLALAAQYYCKPFYVITTKDKFVKTDSYQYEQYPSGEITNLEHPNLKIINYYFEIIDSGLITRIITD